MCMYPNDLVSIRPKMSTQTLTTDLVQQITPMKKAPRSEHNRTIPPAGMRPIQIDALARVALSSPEMLPDCPGIYFALDNANRVWYIGMAESSIRDRVMAHDRMTDFKRKSVTCIAWESVERSACRGREGALI